MRIGEVSPNKEAILLLTVYGATGQQTVIPAVLDTGYTEYLTLPPALIAALGLPYQYALPMYLADGNPIHVRVFEGKILWAGQVRAIPVQETEGDMLLGMSLLYGFRLTMDAVDGGAVFLAPLP